MIPKIRMAWDDMILRLKRNSIVYKVEVVHILESETLKLCYLQLGWFCFLLLIYESPIS